MMDSGDFSAMTKDIRVVYKEIQEQIQKDLQDELIKFYDGHSMDWNFIRRNLEKLPTTSLYHEYLFWNLFRFLMDIFDSYKIDDLCLVEDVLQYAIYLKGCWCVRSFPSENQLRLWFEQRGIYRNKNHLTFEKVDDVTKKLPTYFVGADLRMNCSIHILRRIPYAWSSHVRSNKMKLMDNSLHTVWERALFGQDYLLSILLKHGVLYLKPTMYHQTAKFMDFTLVMLWKRTLIGRPFAALKSRRYQFKHRLLEVLRGIEIIAKIMYYRENNLLDRHLETVSCFMKIFDSIPEPFIKVQEVREALEYLVGGDPEELDSSMVEPLCEEFEKNFPESTGPRTPRSLKHLIRCQIRECLRKVFGLPYKVSLLPIPIRLQKYINLEL